MPRAKVEIEFSLSSPSSFASTITGVTVALRAAAGWLWLAATKRWVAGATPRLNDAAAGSMAANRARQETRSMFVVEVQVPVRQENALLLGKFTLGTS